jgi:hypothetical protein
VETNISSNLLESPRTARFALWGGIGFSVLFTALIWWAGQRLASFPHLPDQGPAWYYWKLATPTFWSHFTAWMFYALHQITFWSLIFYAQTRVKAYSKGLHPVNVWALGANAFFILLHFVQTHIWYDGLAQDVSIFSSQGSVILMLVAILLMENQRRGLLLGKKVSFAKRIGSFARKSVICLPGPRFIRSGITRWKIPLATWSDSCICSCCFCRAACS